MNNYFADLLRKNLHSADFCYNFAIAIRERHRRTRGLGRCQDCDENFEILPQDKAAKVV